MKILLPFLFIFCLPFLSFTDKSDFEYCPPVEEESVNTLIKICTFAFLNTGGNTGSCQTGTLEIDVDQNCIGTTEGTVRAINLNGAPIVGEEYPLLQGMPDIYYEYELPNGTNHTVGPIRDLTYYGDHVTGANGLDFPIFEYQIPIVFDVSLWCGSGPTLHLPITIRLLDDAGAFYPVGNYADSNEAFYCQIFEETCDDCNEQVLGCNGGYNPYYNALICGDCGQCERRRSAITEELTESKIMQDINVQPNPFDELLSVKFSMEENSDVQLSFIDAKGSIVRQLDLYKDKGDHNINIDTNDFARGIYFIKISVNSELYTEKIIKL